MDMLTGGISNSTICPEWMQDGRGLTDYRPRGDIYLSTAKFFNTTSSTQFRTVATQKATDLMGDYNKLYLYKNYCDCSDFSNNPLSSCNKQAPAQISYQLAQQRSQRTQQPQNVQNAF
jgi:hypothetical protein